MIQKIPTQSNTRDQLVNDLKSVISGAESWLRNGGQLTGEELKAAKAKFEQTLSSAKTSVVDIEETVVERAKIAAKATDTYVADNPWKSVGLGAAIGVVIGMLIARK